MGDYHFWAAGLGGCWTHPVTRLNRMEHCDVSSHLVASWIISHRPGPLGGRQLLLVGSHPDSHAECCFTEAIVGGDIQAIGRSHDIERLALLSDRAELFPKCTCFRPRRVKNCDLKTDTSPHRADLFVPGLVLDVEFVRAELQGFCDKLSQDIIRIWLGLCHLVLIGSCLIQRQRSPVRVRWCGRLGVNFFTEFHTTIRAAANL